MVLKSEGTGARGTAVFTEYDTPDDDDPGAFTGAETPADPLDPIPPLATPG